MLRQIRLLCKGRAVVANASWTKSASAGGPTGLTAACTRSVPQELCRSTNTFLRLYRLFWRVWHSRIRGISNNPRSWAGESPLNFLGVFWNHGRNALGNLMPWYFPFALLKMHSFAVDLKTGNVTDPGITGMALDRSVSGNIQGNLLMCGGAPYRKECFSLDKNQGLYITICTRVSLQ